MTKKRQLALALAILAAGTLAGGLIGPRLGAASESNEDPLRTFSQILNIVQERYVEEVSPEVAIHGAIRGMIKTLDPHSNFLDDLDYRGMLEEQQGSFSGLGIVISKPSVEKPLTVISPIEGTPAHRAGIRAGDVISQIEKVDTLDWTVDQALKKLRGRKGTKVNITISRPGDPEPLEYTITRDDIPTQSIQYSFMLRPDVGYIKVRSFTRTTDQELEEALSVLREAGMKRLILDLRGNPGGLLEQAVKMADRFLPRNQKIVYTKGRTRGSDQEFLTSGRGNQIDFPLIVLVNKYSASASEIVAGAIQDHDRGLIVGKPTWGKGLVQTVYPLSQRSALALTTARYYTPSGRLIQRDYDSLEDYLSYDDDFSASSDRDERRTDSGRTVYGGGGITPDVIVDPYEMNTFLRRLELRESAFFNFAIQYNSRQKELPPDFSVDDKVMVEFKKFLKAKDIPFTASELEENDEYIRTSIHKEILSSRWGGEEGFRVFVEIDPQVQKALESFPQARQLARLDENERRQGSNPDQ